MKKKSQSRILRLLKRIVNARLWFDWDRFKSSTIYLFQGVTRLFVTKKTSRVESFTKVQKKLKLTDEELHQKQKSLLRLSMVMLCMAAFMFFYTVYEVFYGEFLAAIVSWVVMGIALTLAFRYHFWYFQIKNRKLGCTVGEWYKQGLLGEEDE